MAKSNEMKEFLKGNLAACVTFMSVASNVVQVIKVIIGFKSIYFSQQVVRMI